MSEIVNTILNLLFIAGLFLLARLYVRYMIRLRHVAGSITLKNGHKYSYLVGDDLVWYDWRGQLRGIDVELPKEFPHVYLDSMKGGGRQSTFYIDPSQQLQLEGDFNRYFQVYAPKGYGTETLSILSPDVMWTMKQHAGEYDIEVYGSHLRIISRRRVFKNPERQQAMLKIAQSVLAELDQRLRSWSESDSRQARKQDLKIYPLHAVRIGRHYVRWQLIYFEVFWFVLMLGGFLLAADLYYSQHDRAAAIAVAEIGIGMFILFSFVTFWGVREGSFRSRQG
ncbi:MAG TPA: hypothetical protein VLG47_04750 [Candidatus Saccharimonadales bacterium]|nr:hypothetical protein [Candidatus Saccharimonadales bacterium]